MQIAKFVGVGSGTPHAFKHAFFSAVGDAFPSYGFLSHQSSAHASKSSPLFPVHLILQLYSDFGTISFHQYIPIPNALFLLLLYSFALFDPSLFVTNL